MVYEISALRQMLATGAFDKSFRVLYPQQHGEACQKRCLDLLDCFLARYGEERPVTLVSAPGRTEIGGNHTDHQRGCVLAGAVDLDVLAIAARNSDNRMRICSKGYDQVEIDLAELHPVEAERNTTASLMRGVAAWFHREGFAIGGFDACIDSQVLVGSGLSSSAAFEVAVGNIFNYLYGGGMVDPQAIAQAGQFAENEYFGKPSGLMDQMASSMGSLVEIDFADPGNAKVTPVPFDFGAQGYHLCIVDTKGSHAGLTGEYAAIPAEMGAVAAYFGKSYLREVELSHFYQDLPELRGAVGDRAVLRAMHFFAENQRVGQQVNALRYSDLGRFLELVVESGESSANCLQNIYAPSQPSKQEMSLALALSRDVLSGRGGAWRVHGGGFAGTIQAFVPDSLLEEYRQTLEGVFGGGSCQVLAIRPYGGICLEPIE